MMFLLEMIVQVLRFCSISAGGSIAAAKRINSGQADIAINWSGGLHHAKKREASGFCYVNDIVLAILELLRFHSRVLYIDIDIHHGDGVEEAFYTTDRVMTCSFHKFGDFFPGTGHVGDRGIGKGKGYAVNVPLKTGIDDETYRGIFRPVINHIMSWYQPGAIVLQCGADSLAEDKLGSFNLSMNGHADCVRHVKSFNIPLVVLGGGGYTIRNVARTWAFETSVCLGPHEELSLADLPYNEYMEYFGPNFKLEVPSNNMDNHNSRDYLNGILAKVVDSLRDLPFAPSTQRRPLSSYPETKTGNDTDDSDLDDRPQGQGLGTSAGRAHANESANLEPTHAPPPPPAHQPNRCRLSLPSRPIRAPRNRFNGTMLGGPNERKKRTFFRSGAFDRPGRGSSQPSRLSGQSGIRTRMSRSTTSHQQFAESSTRLDQAPNGFPSLVDNNNSSGSSSYPPLDQDNHLDPEGPPFPESDLHVNGHHPKEIILNWDFISKSTMNHQKLMRLSLSLSRTSRNYSSIPFRAKRRIPITAAGLIIGIPLAGYLIHRSQIKQVYPDSIHELLRQALRAEHRKDNRKTDILFSQAYEQSKQLVRLHQLDWFNTSAIAIRWAASLERTAKIDRAIDVYQLVFDDLRLALNSLSLKERIRTIEIAQRLAYLIPLSISTSSQRNQTELEKRIEESLTFSFYARRGQIDFALPLYLQTLNLLLPAKTEERVEKLSDERRCQAATVMNNIGQLLFFRSETERGSEGNKLRSNAIEWFLQSSESARQVLHSRQELFDVQSPPINNFLTECREAFIAANANLESLDNSPPHSNSKTVDK
ncbi:hypothetical protein PSTT_14080 [Puccinia striiformis]|uniref:histone deacetylase n=1 Tax=Puccinia striiformis TaxID=27350 RepID=A0A2S4UP03_9BASI|nr:hypothetical protein PSTT_14080 [Puccinia striiformis]